MPHRRDDDVGGAEDLEERHVARVAERNDQLAEERALARLAAREGGGSQGGEARLDRDQRLFGELEIPTVSLELAVENEIEQALQVGLCLTGQADPETHRRVAAALRFCA